MDQEVGQKNRILKAVVIILGVLLVVCFLIVIGTLAVRMAKMGGKDDAQAAPIEEIVVHPAFGTVDVAVPEGARLGTVSADGTSLFLVIEDAGRQQIVVIDHWTGAERGRIRLVPHTE